MKKLKVMMMTLMMCLVSVSVLTSCEDIFQLNKDKSGMVDGYEAVDLGLSVRWATCNVGAKSETDVGYYFAWGETENKYKFYTTNYKFCIPEKKRTDKELEWLYFAEDTMRFENGDSITKYCLNFVNISVIYGKNQPKQNFDNKNILDLIDDAAYVNMGEHWRMPTQKECEELIACEWVEMIKNSTPGYKIKGPNGNTIFLPKNGIFVQNRYPSSSHKNFGIHYWSSQINVDEYWNYIVYWGYPEIYTLGIDYHSINRFFGLPIRAVTK